jgi:hemolysin activation/secretion protein
MPPQQGSVEAVQQGEALTSFAAHDYQVHVFGAREFGAQQLAAIVSGANTLSNGLRALVSAHYGAGYPGASLSYAVAGHDVFVLITLEGIASVQAEAPLGKYFESLAGASPLTASALEPRRVLATMHADRAGLIGKPELVPGVGGATFALQPQEGPGSTHGSIELGNPGNRFVGRYFADLELSTGTRWGDELRSLTRSTVGPGDGATEGDYLQQDLAWNRVTTWGIFGIGGRYVAYGFDPAPGTTWDGEIRLGEVRWQYPVLADFDSRLITQAKVDRTDKTTEDQTGALLQHELYTSAELSGTYQRAADLRGSFWDFEAGLALRQGLGSGKAPIVAPALAPDLDYLLYRGALIVRHYFAKEYSLALETSGQYSSNTVPEQQQIVLGGFGSLSTALPGVATGDSGFVARLVGALGAYNMLGLVWRPKLFVDYGQAHFDELGGGSPGLTDAGAQLDLSRGSWFEGSVAYAERIAERDIPQATLENAEADLYFRVKFKF